MVLAYPRLEVVVPRRRAANQDLGPLARRSRAEDLYLSGGRDRSWFDAEDARTASEIAEADAQLARLPAAPDAEAITRAYGALRDMAALVGSIDTPDAKRAILRDLGAVIYGPDGVSIEYRDVYADFGRMLRT